MFERFADVADAIRKAAEGDFMPSAETGGYIAYNASGWPVECSTFRQVFAVMGWEIPPEHEAAITAIDEE